MSQQTSSDSQKRKKKKPSVKPRRRESTGSDEEEDDQVEWRKEPNVISNFHKPPHSSITGTLNQLKEDIILQNSIFQPASPLYESPQRCAQPVSGLEDIYVQNTSGKFTLAPREIARQATTKNTRPCHLEEISILQYETALDMAIFIQKIWSSVSKICFGLLGGMALFYLILVDYIISPEPEGLVIFLWTYSQFAALPPMVFYILLIICLVSLFDWFDLAHVDIRHMSDTITFRQTWFLIGLYLGILLLTVGSVHFDERFIFYPLDPNVFEEELVHPSENEQNIVSECTRIITSIKSGKANLNETNVQDCISLDFKDLQSLLTSWKVLNTFRCLFSIIGWCIVAVTSTEDLLMLHLQGLKKYDKRPYGKSSISLSG